MLNIKINILYLTKISKWIVFFFYLRGELITNEPPTLGQILLVKNVEGGFEASRLVGALHLDQLLRFLCLEEVKLLVNKL